MCGISPTIQGRFSCLILETVAESIFDTVVAMRDGIGGTFLVVGNFMKEFLLVVGNFMKEFLLVVGTFMKETLLDSFLKEIFLAVVKIITAILGYIAGVFTLNGGHGPLAYMKTIPFWVSAVPSVYQGNTTLTGGKK